MSNEYDMPDLINELTNAASNFMTNHYGEYTWSIRVPTTAYELARWWASSERPINLKYEKPQKRKGPSGKTFWSVPYIDYCRATLNKFMAQDPSFQDLIIDAKQWGLQWRGDDRVFFESLIQETAKMRENPEEYKAQTLSKLKAMI